MKTGVRIFTFGCKVNQCDSDDIAHSLAARGYQVDERVPADTFIVNTCTVTSTADAKARKLIRRLHRDYPNATLIVTGCLAERDPSSLLALPGVSAVVPNSHKLRVGEFLPQLTSGATAISYHPTRTRAFLKIQDGCDRHCTYCAVPDARGSPLSRPPEQVMAALEESIKLGVKEVVLCGIRLGAYGKDRGGPSLAALLNDLRTLPIPRLRLSSIEPMDLDDDLIEALAGHPILCHHLHLPLQSGDDAILAAMGRDYTSADFTALVNRVRNIWPDAAFTTDIMVAFPGETDRQFDRTLDYIRELGLNRVHVFPYSRRPNTPAAARRDQIPSAKARLRLDRMLALTAELEERAARQFIGEKVSVLIEERGAYSLLSGHTQHYQLVRTPGPAEWIGRIIEVIPMNMEKGVLTC